MHGFNIYLNQKKQFENLEKRYGRSRVWVIEVRVSALRFHFFSTISDFISFGKKENPSKTQNPVHSFVATEFDGFSSRRSWRWRLQKTHPPRLKGMFTLILSSFFLLLSSVWLGMWMWMRMGNWNSIQTFLSIRRNFQRLYFRWRIARFSLTFLSFWNLATSKKSLWYHSDNANFLFFVIIIWRLIGKLVFQWIGSEIWVLACFWVGSWRQRCVAWC